jgi:hypothetical protein
MTDNDLRIVYNRWVGERDCLVKLGYSPAQPPSFETFVQSWTTGPWMPIDGVDVSNWTDVQYKQAKAQCNLEFLELGQYDG